MKTAINYGAMSGLFSFFVFLALYYKGINPLGSASWLGAWIPVVFICIATKYYRDHFLDGEFSYGQGMKIGLMTSLAASLLFALLIYIFTTLVDDNVVTMFKNEALQGMEETKFMFSKKMYNQAIESIEKISISGLAFNDFLTKMVGALLVTFVTAAAFRKQNVEIEREQ